MQLKVYYSHCKAIYGTKQETRDIILLSQLGFAVVNPGTREVKKAFEQWKEANARTLAFNPMDFFLNIVLDCQAVAFRGLPFTDHIPSGTHMEIMCALANNIPVIELPTNIEGRGLTYKETVEYLKEVGQR